MPARRLVDTERFVLRHLPEQGDPPKDLTFSAPTLDAAKAKADNPWQHDDGDAWQIITDSEEQKLWWRSLRDPLWRGV